jgi:antitoxin ParD1/3/4
MTSMNISLPHELNQYVEGQSKMGYRTPSQYVRELIREDRKRHAREELEALLLEGLESGEPMVADEKFWTALKTETADLLQSRRKQRNNTKRK